MADAPAVPPGPDLAAGVSSAEVHDGVPFLGHVGDDAVLVTRVGGQLRAIGATCTHYGGPLAEGLIVGDTVRCPWHHACFSLQTGEALAAPALDPVPCFDVSEHDGRITVDARRDGPPKSMYAAPTPPGVQRVVIVGGGAAAVACAEMLRRIGFQGSITMLDANDAFPVDRPNLSKDYLAGNAQEEWVNLRAPEFYEQQHIDLVRGARATRIDTGAQSVSVEVDGATRSYEYDRLLVATGATPNRLDLPGGDSPKLHYLRTLADSRAIIAAAEHGRRAVVIGASFIGLEVAASLRARDVHVEVIAPEQHPLGRVLGHELGGMIQQLHESHGVVFHLATRPTEITDAGVRLDSGETLECDFVVAGVGVHPNVELAHDAGLNVGDGVMVNAQLETSAPGVFAAGDIANYPDPRVGRVRIEHWVVAERQGQTAARNMLGAGEAFTPPPFFWSQHYDVAVSYVGRTAADDRSTVDGDPAAHDCTVAWRSPVGALHAEADVGRDLANLRAERALELEP